MLNHWLRKASRLALVSVRAVKHHPHLRHWLPASFPWMLSDWPRKASRIERRTSGRVAESWILTPLLWRRTSQQTAERRIWLWQIQWQLRQASSALLKPSVTSLAMPTCQVSWSLTTIDFDGEGDLFPSALSSSSSSSSSTTSFLRWETPPEAVAPNSSLDPLARIWRVWGVSLRVSFTLVGCLYGAVFLSAILRWSASKQAKVLSTVRVGICLCQKLRGVHFGACRCVNWSWARKKMGDIRWQRPRQVRGTSAPMTRCPPPFPAHYLGLSSHTLLFLSTSSTHHLDWTTI